MEPNKSTQQQSFPIMGNATLFIVPFHYGEESENQSCLDDLQNFVVHESDNSLWTLEKNMLTDEGDGSVIYPYIMSFLQGQMMPQDNNTDSHLAIYSISLEKRTIINKFWNKFAQSTHTIEVGSKDEPRQLCFKFFNGSYNTLKPHLFIFSSARIGLLTFGIELTTPNATSDDLKLLNYNLHKIAKPITKCVCTGFNIAETNNPIQKEAQEKAFNNARIYIEEHFSKQKQDSNNVEFSWNMKTFIDLMLKDVHGLVNGVESADNNRAVSETPVELFTPPRIHLFTFCGINDIENQYTKENVLPELYRLSRCVNDKYLLPYEEINFHEGYLQTFENVYAASTVEGTAFIALSKEQNNKFFEGFVGILALRYVWIYLLAMIQRYSLLNIDRMLVGLDTSNSEEEDKIKKHHDMLWRYLESIRNVKVRCHFTDISPFTQHNEFYEHCCDKLHVSSAYNEIDHKTKALNLTISHDLQLLQDKRAVQEKLREKKLNLFLAIFAVLQGISILYGFFDAIFERNFRAVVLYCVCLMICEAIVHYLYKKYDEDKSSTIKSKEEMSAL